jgi:CRP/FNR family transcriptional regulator
MATDGTLASLYPALAGLPGVDAEGLPPGAQRVDVPAGTVLFDEHQPCSGFPLLLQGAIRVSKASASGREIQLYRVLPGEACVLTSGCLLGHQDYNARGVAESDLRLAILPKALFERLIGSHAPFRQYVFGLFAERITELMQLVEAVAFRKLDQRLAGLLLGKGRVVHATHQQLAEELGSVREIVSRLLKSFAEQGLVSLGREQVEVLDPRRLREIAAA